MAYKIAGEFGVGDSEFGYAGAYINHKSWSSSKESKLNYENKRCFFGSDKSNGFYYTYCSFIKLPVGKGFKITLAITGQNSYFSGYKGNKIMRTGYSLSAPAEGTERTSGKSNTPSGVTSFDFTMPITSSSATAYTTGTVTFDLPDEYSGKKVYFYFWGKDVTSSYSCFPFREMTATLAYSSYTSVSDPSIKKVTPTMVDSSTKIKIYINPSTAGTSNNVAGYRVYYGSSSVTSSSNYVTVDPPSTNIITLRLSDVGSPSAGKKVYFGLQAIGSASGYNSKLSASSDYVIVNTPPRAPTVELYDDMISGSGASKTIGIKTLWAYDEDDEELTYYYACSSSPTTPSTGWKSVPSDKEIECTSEKPYIHFRAEDSCDYGPATYVKLTVNDGPTSVGVYSVAGEGYIGCDGPYYTRKISVAATGLDEYTYEWQYCYGTSANWKDLGVGKTLSNVELEEGTGEIWVRFTATDSFGDSHTIEGYRTGLRYLKSPTFAPPDAYDAGKDINITLYQLSDCQNHTSSDRYSHNMSAKLSLAQMGSDDAMLAKIEVSLSTETETFNVGNYTDDFSSANNKVEKIFNFDFNKEKINEIEEMSLVFKFYVKNEAGDYRQTGTTEKALKFYPLVTSIFSPELTDAQKTITIDVVENIMTPFEVRYSGLAGIDRYTVRLVLKETNPRTTVVDEFFSFSVKTDSTASISITKDGSTITGPQKLFQRLSLISNKDYEGRLLVGAVNKLGETLCLDTKEFSAPVKIKTTTPCVFEPLDGQNAPHILQYTSHSSTRPSQGSPNWSQTSIDSKKRMFNPGEYIYFDTNYKIVPKMNLYYDGSGNAPTTRACSYNYAVSYTTVTDDSGPTKDSVWYDVADWLNLLSLNTLQVPTYLSPQTGPEKIFFRIRVKDEFGIYVTNPSKNNEDSIYATDPGQYLLWCRKVEPAIRISEHEIVESNGHYLIRFKVTDFGGNDKGYDNFNRGSSTGVDEGNEGAMKITWSCGAALGEMTPVTGESIKGRISDFEPQEDGKTKEFDFGTLNGLTGRIYIQATITFYYNSAGDTLTTQTGIYSVYTEVPTVAYRNHHLGLNIKPDEVSYEEDVLIISDFNGRRYVHLVGLDDRTAQPREIFIDLKTGTVTGLVVDGGSW